MWLDMDQAELDAAYDQAKYASNLPQIFRRMGINSDIARRRLGPPTRIAYGPTPVEALDLYATTRPNAPVNVFFHGGAWKQRWAKDWAFPAEMFVHAGAHFVAVDFTSVDDTGGSLMPMAEQVRKAVAGVYRNAHRFGAIRSESTSPATPPGATSPASS